MLFYISQFYLYFNIVYSIYSFPVSSVVCLCNILFPYQSCSVYAFLMWCKCHQLVQMDQLLNQCHNHKGFWRACWMECCENCRSRVIDLSPSIRASVLKGKHNHRGDGQFVLMLIQCV